MRTQRLFMIVAPLVALPLAFACDDTPDPDDRGITDAGHADAGDPTDAGIFIVDSSTGCWAWT